MIATLQSLRLVATYNFKTCYSSRFHYNCVNIGLYCDVLNLIDRLDIAQRAEYLELLANLLEEDDSAPDSIRATVKEVKEQVEQQYEMAEMYADIRKNATSIGLNHNNFEIWVSQLSANCIGKYPPLDWVKSYVLQLEKKIESTSISNDPEKMNQPLEHL